VKKHTGGLTSYLNQTTQKMVDSLDHANQITELDIQVLEQNERNFYGIREIESLAAMILTSGYIEPLEVKSLENGKFKIIAGHRRRAAVALLIEKGKRINPKVPCIIKTFEAKGCLSAEEIESCCLIFSNLGQRQGRTVSEKLEEVHQLEPIARKVYEEERNKGNLKGDFRRFFAEEFLNTSASSLQRLLSLEKLIPEARLAVDTGVLSETAAAKLAALSQEEQDEYMFKLKAGEANGAVKDIPAKDAFEIDQEQEEVDTLQEQELVNTSFEKNGDIEDISGGREPFMQAESEQESESVEENSEIPASADEKFFQEEKIDLEQLEQEGQQKLFIKSESVPQFDDAQAEANSWVLESLSSLLEQAIKMMAKEKQNGNEKLAAQWDVRRAKVALLMAVIKE